MRDRLSLLSYLMLAFYGYFLYILGPITPFLQNEFSLSYTVSSFHFSALAIGIITAGLFGHLLIRKVGRWIALWIGAYGMSAGAILLVSGHGPVLTVGASFLMGLVGSLLLSVVPSILSDHHGENRAVALSEANVVASVIGAAAPLLVGLFAATVFGWRAALVVGALLPFALRLGFGKVEFPATSEENKDRGKRSRLPVLYWVYWSAIVLAVSIEFCMVYWSADYFVKILGMPEATASRMVSLFVVGMIIGRFVVSRIVGRFGSQRVVGVSVLLAGTGFVAFWAAPSSLVSLVGLLFTGLGVAGLYPLILSMAMGSANGDTAKAGARAPLASGLAIFALPLVLGRLADAVGIQRAYAIVFVLILAVFLINRTAASFLRLKKTASV